MRLTLVAFLVALGAVALATPVEQQKNSTEEHVTYKTADKQHLNRQKDILRLFKYVNQPSYYKDHVEISKSFFIESNVEQYTKPAVIKEFLQNYHQGMLPRDHIFSVFHQDHLKQAIALFRILYYTKDYDTFYKTAVWARNHVNQGLFLYAFSVAVLHHPATYGVVLPPIYEIYPYYFYNSEVIRKAQQHKQQFGRQQYLLPEQHNGYGEYTVRANYSGWYLNVNPEQSLSYYTEDVGINAYYYYYNLYRPFWLSSEEVYMNTLNRGEEYYYFHQQFLARYYLERLSNNLGEIGVYDYEQPLETGYTSSLIYPNGLSFPQRPNWAEFGKNYYNYGQSYSFKTIYGDSLDLVKDYERRIRATIDARHVHQTNDDKIVKLSDEEGFNILGNIIEANPDSLNTSYYGDIQTYARHLLGYAKQPLHKYQVAPSVLEHFETSLRDPAFYQFYKRLVLYFQEYKTGQQRYNYSDLEYPGVKVKKVQVTPLVTYFEDVDADLTNAVFVSPREYETDSYQVRVRQQRLNHKAFAYNISVVSQRPTQAVVRVFLGPKYDEYGRFIDIDENRINFVEFDTFRYDLVVGQNAIVRNSSDIHFSDDHTNQTHLYRRVHGALNGGEEFEIHSVGQVKYTYPNRYLLPKGKRGGQTYQFFVIVSPYKSFNQTQQQYQRYQKQQQQHQQQHQIHQGHEQGHLQSDHFPIVGLGVQNVDAYPLGYPFDRPIDQHNFNVPNAFFQDVVIYHQHVHEIDSSHPNHKASPHQTQQQKKTTI